MIQNIVNWFTGTVIFFPFLFFYERLSPIFSPQNNQRSFINDDVTCMIAMAEKLTHLLRYSADVTDFVQR